MYSSDKKCVILNCQFQFIAKLERNHFETIRIATFSYNVAVTPILSMFAHLSSSYLPEKLFNDDQEQKCLPTFSSSSYVFFVFAEILLEHFYNMFE